MSIIKTHLAPLLVLLSVACGAPSSGMERSAPQRHEASTVSSALVSPHSAEASLSEHRVDDIRIDTIEIQYVNSHLVRSGQSAFLVDSGYGSNTDLLVQALRDLGQDPAALRAILVTHAHADHAGGALALRERFGVPIVAGARDRQQYLAGTNGHLCPTSERAQARVAQDQAGTFAGFEADVWIDEASDLQPLVGLAGSVQGLAGHTPGSLVVSLSGVVFVGDLLRGRPEGPEAAVHLYMCDLSDNARDIAWILDEFAPAAEWAFVGHFGPLARAAVRHLLSSGQFQ